MRFIDFEEKASKCFEDFETYYKERTAFIDDYQFFDMYMKRNAKSAIRFSPKAERRSLQSVIDNYSHETKGLEKAFCIYYIMRHIILGLQEWNAPVFEDDERDELLRYLVKYEYVDIDAFCTDFIGCSRAHPEIRAKIDEILNFDIMYDEGVDEK